MPNCFAKNTLGIPLTNRPRITYWTFAGATPRYTRTHSPFFISQEQTFSTRAKQIPPFLEHFPKNTFLSLCASASLHLCVCWGERGEGRDNIAFDLADEGASARKTILHIDLRRKQQVASINKKRLLWQELKEAIFWIEWKSRPPPRSSLFKLCSRRPQIQLSYANQITRRQSTVIVLLMHNIILSKLEREMLDRRRSRNNWLLAFSVAKDLWSFAARLEFISLGAAPKKSKVVTQLRRRGLSRRCRCRVSLWIMLKSRD